ncbi:MAG TPA: NAD(P)H-hydrate dehydratase [Nitrospirae bacterium]|nr:NAD(P)H-hydrate dehydratase [Nitrospirota bacterium]HDZ00298.1 NAD(P)H-hydrate dehydratase [Nitrospirota bacterium]
MLKITTAKEMQQIDRITIEKYGIAGTILMERAGLAVVSRIHEIFFQNRDFQSTEHRAQSTDKRRIVVLCGGGNNGGDGFVIARILHNQGRGVEVYLTARPENLKGDAKVNYDAARKFGLKIYPAGRFLKSRFSNVVIVDALLGTGLSKEVRAPLSDVIKKINGLSFPVVSVDIPSGISSDTGRIMGCAVKAQSTVTFGLPKRGHLLYPGAEYTGNLYVEDIGFPQKLLASEKIKVNLVQKEDALSLLPARPAYSHKGTYGHVLLIAGSKGKTGAALMAAKACLRTGAGLVTIGIPETLVNTFQSRVTEEMILPLPDKGNGTLSSKAADAVLEFIEKRANVLAIGPGISVDDEISDFVSLLITESGVPVVIDADGINAIAGRNGILKKSRSPVILTPHSGEMARLLNRTQNTEHRAQMKEHGTRNTTGIEQDRINTAISFAKKTKTYLVLKGAPTVIAAPDGKAFINSTGNPGMATAGTGDVLTGMISAFLAQKLNPQSAAILGVYMHGFIGDIAAEKKGEHSLIASDIINSIPRVFRSVVS